MRTLKLLITAIVSLFTVTLSDGQTNKANMKNSGNSAISTKQIIVDVRSTGEWVQDGHSDCSVNYPLDQIDGKLEELKKYDKVIFVCRSGNRAGIAKAKLQSAGYKKEIENLGPWQNITCKSN